MLRKVNAKILSTLIGLFLLVSCYEEFDYVPEITHDDALLNINGQVAVYGSESGLMLFPVEGYGQFSAGLSFNQSSELFINDIKIFNNDIFDFGTINSESTFQVKIFCENGTVKTFSLKFTLLPVVQIRHRYGKIPDEPKVISTFYLNAPCEENSVFEYSKIEVRGGSTNSLPKKSYGFTFVGKDDFEKPFDISLLQMPRASDWILNSAYIDKSNVRNKVSFDIWQKIQEGSERIGNNVMHSATEGRFVEVFINNTYNGLYCLTETIDEKKLGLEDNATGQAYLYKSEYWSEATTFTGLPDTTGCIERWAEWEQKYPAPDICSYWNPLYNFINFVVFSDEKAFSDSIASYFNIDQAIDFYVLLNLILGVDNAGKNVFLAREDEISPFVIIPWDLDVSWGRNWQGFEKSPYDIVSYNLFDRLIKTSSCNFRQRVKEQWEILRSDFITSDSLQKMFNDQFDFLINSGAVSREGQTWPSSLPDVEAEREYINSFINIRLECLDAYFRTL